MVYHHAFGVKGYKVTMDFYYGPMVAVFMGIINEVLQEFKRALNDIKINGKLHNVIRKGKALTVKNKNVRVGDVVKLGKGDRVPADIVLLHVDDFAQICYVQTDQIDGEIDWKIKEPVRYTQRLISNDISNLSTENWEMIVEAPNDELKSFQANFYVNGMSYYEPVTFSQFLMTNTKVASGHIYGLVVYVGKESKLKFNKVKNHYGKTQMDIQINNIVLLLMGTYFATVIIFSLMSHWMYKANFMNVFLDTCLILNNFVSFSAVTINQLSGYVHAGRMKRMGKGKVSRVNNFLKTEELGRVQIILSDKTGTMTKNQMVFKNFISPYGTYDADLNMIEISSLITTISLKKARKVALTAQEQHFNECIFAFMLCNNLAPSTDSNGDISIQASNPDEVACLEFCETLGFKIRLSSNRVIEIEDEYKNKDVFEYLNIFPFSSQRRRTDMIVKNKTTGEIKLYLKGADEVVSKRLKIDESRFIQSTAKDCASKGLRALSFSYKQLTEEEYETFNEKILKIFKKFEKRDILADHAIYELEKDSTALCVTGTEDLLQDNIKGTLDMLHDANIAVWMITGDKVETAKCISLSSGLKTPSTTFHTIASQEYLKIKEGLIEYNSHTHFLVISGDAYGIIEQTPELKKLFYSKAVDAREICFCRFLPNQKASLAAHLNKKLGKVVAAVGDGANDVNMLEMASIGIGIEGRDGFQAALSSDFAITQFSDLTFLLVFSGRSNYFKTAIFLKVITLAKLTTAFILFFFSVEMYMVFYRCLNSFFMCFLYDFYILPVAHAFFHYDKDIPESQIGRFAYIYRESQAGKILQVKSLLSALFQSILQSFVSITLILYFTSSNLGVINNTIIITAWTVHFLSFWIRFNKITLKTYVMFAIGLINIALIHMFITKRTNPQLFNPRTVMKGIVIGSVAFIPVYLWNFALNLVDDDKRMKALKMSWEFEDQRLKSEKINIIDF